MSKKLGMVAALLAGALAAQDAVTIGTFVDPDGKPIAAAAVTFATTPVLLADSFAPAQIVEATTDGDGRFRTRLRTGADYSVWAIGPADATGRWRSRVTEGVVAGNVLALRAEVERAPQPPILCVPSPELGPGPFLLELRGPATHGPVHRLPLPADGRLALPELPPGRSMLRLLRTDGSVAVGWFWPHGERTSPAPVRRCAVRVVDDAGQPVAGVRVAAIVTGFAGDDDGFYLRNRAIDSRIEGPPTDADGGSVIMAAEHHVQGFVAWTADRQARVARHGNSAILDGDLQPYSETALSDDVPVQLVLRKAPVLRGVLRRGPEPLAGRGVVAAVNVTCRRREKGNSSSTLFPTTQVATTDGQGRFELSSVVRPIGGLQLGFDTGEALPALALPRTGVPAEPIDVDLATWPLTTLRLQTGAALPPTASRFLLWPADPEHLSPPVVLVGERSGIARARLEPGEWFVVATDGEGLAALCVSLSPGREQDVLLPTTPLAVMAGRILDADGKPMADAAFSCHGWSRVTGAEPVVNRLDRLLQRHCIAINGGLVGRSRSESDGRFRVRFLPVPGLVPAGRILGTESIEFRAAEDLELRMSR
jgi:hypothetical protein